MRKQKKEPFCEKIVDAVDMPKEVILGYPKITIISDREITVENYKGILEYENNIIRLNTSMGIVAIEGENLDISSITDTDISLCGRVVKTELDFKG